MKGDEQQGRVMPGTVNLIASIVTHILLLAPVISIVILYIGNHSFFAWHPICMSVGVGLVMMEAVFGISGEANLISRVSRLGRITVHWILHTIGLGLMLIGLVIIVVSKNNNGRYHFTTSHGKLGISAIVLAILIGIFGILTINTRWLYPRVRPVLIKVGHAFGGIAITILLLASMITGAYKHSFPGSETGKSLIFASFFIAGAMILAKPILGAVSRSRVIFKSSNPTNKTDT